MKKLQVNCPTCGTKGHIEVSEDSVKNVQRGLIAVNVEKDMVCDHSFIAYVDKNLKIRDCYQADFKIEIASDGEAQEVDFSVAPTADCIEYDTIKMNLPEQLFHYFLRAAVFRKKILLIGEKTYQLNHYVSFFKYIMEGSFEADIHFASKDNYKKNKKQFKDYIIFEGAKIIRDKDKILQNQKLKEESKIVQKFMEEYDLMSSLIILRNDIQKLYKMAETLMDYIQKHKGEEMTSKKLIDYLSQVYNTKITISQLNFLIDIVQQYFGKEVPKLSDISDFLGFL